MRRPARDEEAEGNATWNTNKGVKGVTFSDGILSKQKGGKWDKEVAASNFGVDDPAGHHRQSSKCQSSQDHPGKPTPLRTSRRADDS